MLSLRLTKLIKRPSMLIIRLSSMKNVQLVEEVRFPQTTRLELDQLLERLDGEAHRRGRLNVGLVRGAMRKAVLESDSINATQALLLIRCTGSLLVSELPIQRQQVLERIFNVFKEKQVQFDVTHYNSYMRISLQNQFFFDPMKILDEMKERKLIPNLTSYRLLIECYARQGKSEQIQQVLNEMKINNFNIEPLVLTHLLTSYAQKGNVERVESLFNLFDELKLKPISETYEQFVTTYLKRGLFDKAKSNFLQNASKMENESFFRLLVQSAQFDQKDLFRSIIESIDKNSLAEISVQFILCATELLSQNYDDYAFLLVDSFPKRDETLRFDLISFTMLNLLKLRLPAKHFRPFSTLSVDDVKTQNTMDFQCEKEKVNENDLREFREKVLQRVEFFSDDKDRWLVVHQLLHHAYQNLIPLAYIYEIYETMRSNKFEYRAHFMRPVLVKFSRIFVDKTNSMSEEIGKFLEFLQRNFSINYDSETMDVLIEFLFDRCRLDAPEIDSLLRKSNVRFNDYWTNLYLSSTNKISRERLNSLKVFLNSNKNFRFEFSSQIREKTGQAIESYLNQVQVHFQDGKTGELFESLRELVDFIEILNKRFVKNQGDLVALNDFTLMNMIHSFDEKKSVDFTRRIFELFLERKSNIPLSDRVKKNVEQSLNSDQNSSVDLFEKETKIGSMFDESADVFIKSIRNPKTMTLRELEDHLIELKKKKMNTSGTISKLLTKYCTECLDGEKSLTPLLRETYVKRIAELESIYFDRNQTTGFPSLGVIAILIDYYSRFQFNLDKVIGYINLSNEADPSFRLDPHKCVSVIRLLVRKENYQKAIELIDSLGAFNAVPNYMYRRVRDLLIDAFQNLKFDEFDKLVKKLLINKYVEPSAVVLSLIVRKSFQDRGPLEAFESVKQILTQWNHFVGFFPIVRKLLRDDCSEELKQVLIKIGKIRNRTFSYEQLSFALIHERRYAEAVRVCQKISRSTFEEHCQRYVRELFYFPTENQKSNVDLYETSHVFDSEQISLINFLDFIEQFPSNARHLSVDTLFFHLFKSYEKTNRLEQLTKLMRDVPEKHFQFFSQKTKETFSQAGIVLPIKSLSSPKQQNRRSRKNERFFDDHDYEQDLNGQN